MSKKQKEVPEYLNVKEAAAYVGVAWNTMNRYIADRLIPAYELPSVPHRRVIRILKKDLESFMERRRKKAS